MDLNIVVLVLGEYTPVSKYLEMDSLPHEKHLIDKGDIYNIKYINSSTVLSTEGSSKELNLTEANGISTRNLISDELYYSSIFNNNPIRNRSDDDMIGMYNSEEGLVLSIPGEFEGIVLSICSNYIYKSQDIGEGVDMLYIIDNVCKENTIYQIEYLVNCVEADTYIFSRYSEEELGLKQLVEGIQGNREIELYPL